MSHLRLLAALLETGQIGRSAAQLGITQPAASRLLAEVEAIIGRPVHQRTGRGMALTDVGMALARRAQRVQMELRDAARDLQEIGSGAVGHVRIGSVTGPALDRVLPALRAARMTLPQVTVEVIVATSDVLNQNLLTGRIDFCIARRPLELQALIAEARIAPEPVALIARRGHPLDRTDLQAKDLMEFDWILPGSESILARAVLRRLDQLNLPKPPQRLSTASFLLTLALLQQSNAIAPLASAVVETFTQAEDAPYVRLPLELGFEVEPYGLLTRAGAALPPVAERLVALIMAQGTNLSASGT